MRHYRACRMVYVELEVVISMATLHPPNSQLFSDNVIASVVQRAWMSDDCIEDEEGDSFDPGECSKPLQHTEYARVRGSYARRLGRTVLAPPMENKWMRGQFELSPGIPERDFNATKPATGGEER
ncbi:hypothetical protein PC123_g21163 [Phytophthora cactorum]|nr:hypothetical protein PC123_g21163 [Phytophthora cactorum]